MSDRGPLGRHRPAADRRGLGGAAARAVAVGPRASPRPAGCPRPTTGDVAAVGRPLGAPLPPAHEPSGPPPPQRVDIPSIGIAGPGRAPAAWTRRGAIDPPPFDQAGRRRLVRGRAPSPAPAGTALLVGHVDTETRPAVFYGLSALRPGREGPGGPRRRQGRRVHRRRRPGRRPRPLRRPARRTGPARTGRAELRLITCGGTFDRAVRARTRRTWWSRPT